MNMLNRYFAVVTKMVLLLCKLEQVAIVQLEY